MNLTQKHLYIFLRMNELYTLFLITRIIAVLYNDVMTNIVKTLTIKVLNALNILLKMCIWLVPPIFYTGFWLWRNFPCCKLFSVLYLKPKQTTLLTLGSGSDKPMFNIKAFRFSLIMPLHDCTTGRTITQVLWKLCSPFKYLLFDVIMKTFLKQSWNHSNKRLNIIKGR